MYVYACVCACARLGKMYVGAGARKNELSVEEHKPNGI